MANWIDKYKQIVSSSYKTHVVISDRDQLFEYAELQQALEESCYRILLAKSSLDVRFLFELEVRGCNEKCIIVAPPDYDPLPDMLVAVHYQSIGLRELFPNLDAKSIQGLSFNALCLLSNIKPYEELGKEKTLKFLLENLYNVDFDTLTNSKSRERILNALITVFLEKNGINLPLTAFLSNLARPYFPELVDKSLTKSNLIAYLQERWHNYLSTGISDIDFQDPVLNKSFGYLFVFDHLRHVKVSQDKLQSLPRSLRIGAFADEKENNDNELDALIQYLEQQQTSIEDQYGQWFNLVQVLAKAKLYELNSENQDLKQRLDHVIRSLNNRFQRFVDNSYSSLFSLSGVRRPVLVTRVLEYMHAQPDQRKCLLVIDGMNYWQWLLIAKTLNEHNIVSSNGATLAFIPTITAWSRQALFRGNKPNLKKDNSNEATLFAEFWRNKGYNPFQIQFLRIGVNQQSEISSISEDVKIVGIVCNDLDDIMHGSLLGDNQLLTSTKQWIDQSKLIQTILSLRSMRFRIFITTDHGNIEAMGVGNLRVKEKVGSISRGKRHIRFSNSVLLNSSLEQIPNLNVGIKDDSIYLRYDEAFTDKNVRVVTHGGSHIWEVLLPFGEVK